MPIRLILGSPAVFLMGSLFVIYGGLLAFRPDRFLRFHDTFIDRSEWNRSADWRKHVREREYKALGLVFCVVGLFLLGYLMFVGLGSPDSN
jgi:hypothetical protein